MIEAALKERFLRDNPTRRLGNLAANLARIDAFGAQSHHRDAVLRLAEESAFFIEWAAPDATPEVQSELGRPRHPPGRSPARPGPRRPTYW